MRRAEALAAPVEALAAPAFKRDEPGLHKAAALLDVALFFEDKATLAAAQPHCVTRSAAADRETGFASVAEAAAIGAGGVLVLPRLSRRWRDVRTGAAMTVHFIGAGPGAADLITLRGARLLAASPVCLYAGSIVPPEMLAHCAPGARLVDTAPLSLDDIEAEFVAAEAAGQDVARLHSGDLSLYSAVAEQLRRLRRRGIAYTLTPGVPAFAAAAAALGRELTVPGLAQTIVLTRLPGRASAMPPGETLDAYAATGATLAIHLSRGIARSRGDDAAAALRRRLPGSAGGAGKLAGRATDPRQPWHFAGRCGGGGAHRAAAGRPCARRRRFCRVCALQRRIIARRFRAVP